MTEPLTPTDCDCRGLPFMPLEVPRLLDSDLVALSTGDEFKAALLIWAKSWSQVPAASMPDDDRILARAAGYPLAEWMGLRDMALRGWVKCTDGRLYHPVVADLALAAQAKRKGQAEKANSRWNKVRAAKAEPAMPPAPKDDAAADAVASKTDAQLMQGKGTVEGTEPPLAPQGAELTLVPVEPKVEDVEIAFNEWNEVARRCGLPVAKGLDKARRRTIAARLQEAGLDGWREAIAGVEQSAFCRGQRTGSDGRILRADLGFVCQAKSFPRLREGFYGIDAKLIATVAPPRRFPDRAIRDFVVTTKEKGEPWAVSYLDPCTYEAAGDTRTITAPNSYIAGKLSTGIPELKQRGIIIAVQTAAGSTRSRSAA